MITFSESLSQRMQAMVARAVGSGASITFYGSAGRGAVRLERRDLSEKELGGIVMGHEPERPEHARYWRVHDIGGLELIEGDWR